MLIAASSKFGQGSPLVFAGDYSYTIYLIHPTILNVSFWLFNRWRYSFQWWLCVIAIAASLLAGIALGKVEQGLNAQNKRRMLERERPTSIQWKRYVAWLTAAGLTIGCFGGLKILPEIRKSGREKFSSYVAVTFDKSDLAESGLHSGWVDSLEFEPAGNGTVTVFADGWAYDPETNTEAPQIAVLADGKSIPVSIAWRDRPGVREALGKPVPISCGFTLKTEAVPVGANLEFYVVLENGSFLPLACSENTVTE